MNGLLAPLRQCQELSKTVLKVVKEKTRWLILNLDIFFWVAKQHSQETTRPVENLSFTNCTFNFTVSLPLNGVASPADVQQLPAQVLNFTQIKAIFQAIKFALDASQEPKSASEDAARVAGESSA